MSHYRVEKLGVRVPVRHRYSHAHLKYAVVCVATGAGVRKAVRWVEARRLAKTLDPSACTACAAKGGGP